MEIKFDYYRAREVPMQRMRLRERGIYALPDGKEYILCAVIEGGYNLYEPDGWNALSLAEYRVYSDGKLYRKLEPTPWSIKDLTDTGRTVEFLKPPATAI